MSTLPPILPQPVLTPEPEPVKPHLQLVKLPPVQLELFSEEPAPAPVYFWDEVTGIGTESFLEEGISVVHTPEGLSVSITGYGGHLGKKSERLVLKKKDGRAVWQLPFDRINEVVVSSTGISITTDLLTELSDRGIRCSLLAKNGRPVSQLNSPVLTGTVATRKAQYEAVNNGRGLNLAVSMINGKLLNQARLLKYFAKGSRESKPELFAEMQKHISRILYHRRQLLMQKWTSLDSARSAIMGYEGTS
ncbi:MAG: CRISPR-associated endonuclease Cas1, partial [bacterium]|nr:CRISPR-associated endonuclease Cas1 [bacterium]